MRKLLVYSVISIALGACSGEGNVDNGATGEAVARITSVPPQVSCISITVAGTSRTVVDNFDVTPGQSALLKLRNLPVGNDLFSASAYPVACASLGNTQPNWVSTSVVGANISTGGVANLQLTLAPAGGANVGINFNGCDADAGTCPGDGGVSCGDGGCVGSDGGAPFDMSPNGDGGGGPGPDLARPADLAHFGD